MDESIPLQLASVNHMEVVAIHMIHLYRDPPGSRRGTGVGTDPVPASIAMAVSMHGGLLPSSYPYQWRLSLVRGTADRACLLC